ncbi:MAG: DinB family protein [Phycisphaerae bacterium]
MTGDPLLIFVQFNAWATRRLIDACRLLDDADLDRRFAIGPGSLRATLRHILGNLEHWTDRAQGRPTRPFPDATASLDQLESRLLSATDALRRVLETADVAEVVYSDFTLDDGGVVKARFTRSAALLHALNHATHHRAQCLNMLRQLGVDPLPEFDLIDWQHEVDDRDYTANLEPVYEGDR